MKTANEVMNQNALIKSTILRLRGQSGFEFQNSLKHVLEIYYQKKHRTFSMPYAKCGDEKNDGWVLEEKLFYQIYAPEHLKNTFKKNIKDKFENDLTILAQKIFKEGKWGGELKKFIFLVNDKENGLPEDSDGCFGEIVKEINIKYRVEIKFEIVGLGYIRNLLESMSIKQLNLIAGRIEAQDIYNIDSEFKEKLIHVFKVLSQNIGNNSIKKFKQEYTRISTLEKIRINDLTEVKEEIETIISNLQVVIESINILNNSTSELNDFLIIKEEIQEKYKEYSISIRGVDLYYKLIEYLVDKADKTYEPQIKYILVYIFDQCEIFEKEK